jgi:IS5 family transposase
LYDIASLRRFVGVDLGCEQVPDETTVLKLRHLLEQHDLGERFRWQDAGVGLRNSSDQYELRCRVDGSVHVTLLGVDDGMSTKLGSHTHGRIRPALPVMWACASLPRSYELALESFARCGAN